MAPPWVGRIETGLTAARADAETDPLVIVLDDEEVSMWQAGARLSTWPRGRFRRWLDLGGSFTEPAGGRRIVLDLSVEGVLTVILDAGTQHALEPAAVVMLMDRA
jgi:hypothetical protein